MDAKRLKDSRHEETRTPDLYRVKSGLNSPKPFACLAFHFVSVRENPQDQPSFGDELASGPKRIALPRFHLE